MAGYSDAKKAKSSLVAIAFGAPDPKKKSSPDAPVAGEDSGGDAHAAAFASFADAMGIPPEKRARAQAGLKQFVKSCMESGYADEE